MVKANYTVIIKGQLRYKKTVEYVVKSTARWIRNIDENSKYDVQLFAGLFVKIKWVGNKLNMREIDTLMNNIRRNSPILFRVSKTSIDVQYSEKGV